MPSNSSIQDFLERDHDRLDALLRRSLDDRGTIDEAAFDGFRRGLLKHIGIEEKLIFKWSERANDAELTQIARTLRLHHGALAALLVLLPSPSSVRAIRSILSVHNPIEEGPQHFYAACEDLMGEEAHAILHQMLALPDVLVATRKQTPELVEAAKRCLVRAGFSAEMLDDHTANSLTVRGAS